MNEWNEKAEELIKETERFIAETEIALFIRKQLQQNETFREGDSYYHGFKEAMINVLEFIHEMTRQRRLMKEMNEPNKEIAR